MSTAVTSATATTQQNTPIAQSSNDAAATSNCGQEAQPSSSKRHVIDLDQINLAFSHWLRAIKVQDSKPKKNSLQSLEIHESVFTSYAPATMPYNPHALPLRTMDDQPPISEQEFLTQVKRVEEAIQHGLHPRLNSKGSSGSYFCKDLDGNIIGIFKPKDEEPYGRLNPKWTKWFHRHFVAPIFGFGRSCLIPNLSYLSEEAASVLDRRLQTYIVPRTQVVSLSSTAFFYDWMDRRAASGKRPRPLPAKSGSFQLFGKGYTDASIFLNEHRWPGLTELPDDATSQPPKHKSRGLKVLKVAQKLCGRAEAAEPDAQISDQDEDASQMNPRAFAWTRPLMDDTRQQLERLVILDYLMRNTDRGLDNFMLRVCRQQTSGSTSPPKEEQQPARVQDQPTRMPEMSQTPPPEAQSLSRAHSYADLRDGSHIHILAIDNSLAFPQHHPRGWRSFAYGWLWLPVSMIGVPWSSTTREHFLALLTSKAWWEETSQALKHTFSKDPDFNLSQFRKQLAVIKGQGLNLVKSLKNPTEGPLELCQRTSCLVWDDVVQVPDFSVLSHSDLTQSMHGDFGEEERDFVASPDEQAPLLGNQSKKTRRLSRFARRFRRRTSLSFQDQPDAHLPRQLSCKEHADSTHGDHLASGFSLLEGADKSARSKKKSRSASFGQIASLDPSFDIGHAGQDAAGDGGSHRGPGARPGHIRMQSSAFVSSGQAVPLKRAIVERIEVVHQKPFFAIC